jgi:hypothetical protein
VYVRVLYGRTQQDHLFYALRQPPPQFSGINSAKAVANHNQLLSGPGTALNYEIRQTIDNAPWAVSIGQNARKKHLVAARSEPIRKWIQGRIARHKTRDQQD